MNENRRCRHRDRAGVSLLARVMWLPNIARWLRGEIWGEISSFEPYSAGDCGTVNSWPQLRCDVCGVNTFNRLKCSESFVFPTCGMWRTGLWLLASPLRPATLANADMTWNKLNLLFLFTFFWLQKYFAQKYQIPDGTKKLRADMMNVQSLLIWSCSDDVVTAVEYLRSANYCW